MVSFPRARTILPLLYACFLVFALYCSRNGTSDKFCDNYRYNTDCKQILCCIQRYEGLFEVQNWAGPISLGYYVDRSSARSVNFLYNLHQCRDIFRMKLSLHVVYQMSSFQRDCEPLRIQPTDLVNCANLTTKYVEQYIKNIPHPFGIYPINVMRNVARRGAQSPLHMMSDVEMVFSQNFAEEIRQLANEHLYPNGKELIVIRRFEIDEQTKPPKNSTELRTLLDRQKAFEFHHKMFPVGHTIDALWHWFYLSGLHEEPRVWKIKYKNPSWEPQFIIHASSPMSEEKIPTRHRDQQALAYELCRAGYSFLLASKVFNVHIGIKEQEVNLDQAIRIHQGRLKTRIFKDFLERLNTSYPNTMRKCGTFVID